MINPREPFTPFLPTTYNVPQEQDRLNVYLVDRFSNFADVINDKKIGAYIQSTENQNGEKWFYKITNITRNGYQTMAYIPSLPNSTSITLRLNTMPQFPIENIDTNFVITDMIGTASKPPSAIGAGDGDFFSFVNEGNSKISFTMSDTEIVITSTTNLSRYIGIIKIEYLRNGV